MDETRIFQFGCQMVSKKAVKLLPFLRVLWAPRLEGAGTCFFLSHISIHDSIHVTWMHTIFHWPKVSWCFPDYIHSISYMFFCTMGFWMCIYIYTHTHTYFYIFFKDISSLQLPRFLLPQKILTFDLNLCFFPQKIGSTTFLCVFFPWGDHKPETRRQNNDLKS